MLSLLHKTNNQTHRDWRLPSKLRHDNMTTPFGYFCAHPYAVTTELNQQSNTHQGWLLFIVADAFFVHFTWLAAVTDPRLWRAPLFRQRRRLWRVVHCTMEESIKQTIKQMKGLIVVTTRYWCGVDNSDDNLGGWLFLSVALCFLLLCCELMIV